jgi:hypothetical protein
MNANRFKCCVFLAIIVMISASGCFGTPVKTQSINNTQALDIKGKEEWIFLLEEYPLYRGIDFYKNPGYGVTEVTFEYVFNSGKGTILHSKNDIDWANKDKSDYYVSGIRLDLKKESGDVYETGMIPFQKDERMIKTFSLPKETFVSFKVKEIKISPRNE